jgi:hypothetical protein
MGMMHSTSGRNEGFDTSACPQQDKELSCHDRKNNNNNNKNKQKPVKPTVDEDLMTMTRKKLEAECRSILRQQEVLQDGTGHASKEASGVAGDTSRVAGRPPRTLSEARLGSDGRPQIADHTNIAGVNSVEELQALQT